MCKHYTIRTGIKVPPNRVIIIIIIIKVAGNHCLCTAVVLNHFFFSKQFSYIQIATHLRLLQWIRLDKITIGHNITAMINLCKLLRIQDYDVEHRYLLQHDVIAWTTSGIKNRKQCMRAVRNGLSVKTVFNNHIYIHRNR